ncbi:methyl-accepting chemotaxis protein [Geomonas azotofigens]|uniref:methyl-accepting chemotaxis protein n=1 Tax=Geomonas azotofigens TaxID=2843196 RepID=UPI001C11A803|nr:methyl-accepting chemotaxis protein [Geomonas azotofigens]MBU5611780.1 methyl-accepting chemotaxis protein [Geomonas azotofigens]
MKLFGNSCQSKVDDQAVEIAKMAQMLDNVDNIVMLCDTSHDNKIIYMNKQARALMQQFRSQLNAGLRGADVANAEGNSIHQFHKDPARIRGIFGEPRGRMPHTAEIPIGEVTLRTSTYPIWDSRDPSKVLCYMACWNDITAEKAVAQHQRDAIERKEYLETRVTQIATAMEEMSMTVNEVARNTVNAADSAAEVAGNAREGQSVVSQAVSEMRKVAEIVRDSAGIVGNLGEKSSKIGEFVAVINDIADQTNLLALNAAIEAARAGEQGRGFAVVADEVRRLADRTVASTKEIRLMVEEIQKETVLAVESIERGKSEAEVSEALSHQVDSSLANIVNSIEQIEHVIAQIATASEEQAATSTTIASNLEEIVRG